MMRIRTFSILLLVLPFLPFVSSAASVDKEPDIPDGLAFIRTIDVQNYVQWTDDHGQGAQSLRIRARYLDPDVNAFVGLLTGLDHFNTDLYIGDPAAPAANSFLWNWGGDFGIRRGKHLWELDLMGAVLNSRLAPAIAIVGEHQLSKQWLFYHRTEIDAFTGGTIADADQGFYWMPSSWGGLEAGYRLFGVQHNPNRNGAHIGIRLLFDSPKIPILFPSLG